MIAESFAWFASWWTGSAIQVGILVSLFWMLLMVGILALVGANRRGEPQGRVNVYRAPRPTAPAQIEPDAAWRHGGAL